jgi:hypothetical protein
MADAGLFIGWGTTVRGREATGLGVFNESVQYWGTLHGDGKIESFEIVLLDPHGGDLAGFALLRGSHEQLDAVRHEEDFRRLIVRGNLVVEGLGVVPATLGDGLSEQIALVQSQLGELT